MPSSAFLKRVAKGVLFIATIMYVDVAIRFLDLVKKVVLTMEPGEYLGHVVVCTRSGRVFFYSIVVDVEEFRAKKPIFK